MVPTSDGGRRTPIRSDYRPNCWVGCRSSSGDKTYNDARVYLETVDELASGECAVVRFYPLSPEAWVGLEVGSSFDVCEGARVVGVARVIEPLSSAGVGHTGAG